MCPLFRRQTRPFQTLDFVNNLKKSSLTSKYWTIRFAGIFAYDLNTGHVLYLDSQCSFESRLSLFTFAAGEDHDHCQVKAERGERRSQADARFVEPEHFLKHQGKTTGN